jgi:hypothetical protein
LTPDDFIRSFFDTIQKELPDAKRGADGRSTRFRGSSAVAIWSNELWEVELSNGTAEPMRRQYDPSNARSSESAAIRFVDAMRLAAGMEPVLRESTVNRYRMSGRPKTETKTG